jgi:hypothetical protein
LGGRGKRERKNVRKGEEMVEKKAENRSTIIKQQCCSQLTQNLTFLKVIH